MSSPDIDVTTLLLALLASPSTAGANPWSTEVANRLGDDRLRFAPAGDGFVAAPGSGLTGRFDVDGATLSSAEGTITVRTAGWGRADALEEMPPGAPRLGACLGREDPSGACVRRLEYVDAGLVEWWAAGPDGFEQGWTVTTPPAGAGLLVVDLAVDGADAVVGDGELWLEGAEAWNVSGLVAWDADGAPLPARFEAAPDGFRVTVDDAGARYPIEIDPVYTTASAILAPETTQYVFGGAVSDAGDVDGDGYDDVIVGAQWGCDGLGCAYVFHGSASGVSATATTILTGEEYADNFGVSVSSAGDVNGDGYDDVIVGAYGYGSASAGRAYVFLGSADGVSGAPGTTLTSATNYSFYGYSVAGAGDVNGDGFDDVLVGAYEDAGFLGRVYVYHGSAAGVSAAAGTTLTADTTYTLFGESVAGAGDVDGDGYDDVIVGARFHAADTGRVYVFGGSAAGVVSTPSVTLDGESTNSSFGRSVDGAGDVDGDGYADVIVGAPEYGSETGRAYVFRGSAGGLATAASVALDGEAAGHRFGESVSRARDVDGDGFGDVIVSAPGDGTAEGRAYVFGGSAGGLSTAAVAALTMDASETAYAQGVSDAGDVDGDGYDDVIVGHGAQETGTAHVHHGYADADGDGYAATVDCDDGDGAVRPGAEERCNEVDDDCDGGVDVDAADAPTWYADADGDGYTDPDGAQAACDQPDGYTTASAEADCDDDDPDAWPGAEDVAGDGVDQDCHGADAPGAKEAADDAGCGCATAPSGGSAAVLALVGLLVARRRRA